MFYGGGLPDTLKRSVEEVKKNQNAVIFGYYVNDPERYGVVEFDDNGEAISLEEKASKSNEQLCRLGYIFYPNNVIGAKKQKPSDRGELEITDINKKYLSIKS